MDDYSKDKVRDEEKSIKNSIEDGAFHSPDEFKTGPTSIREYALTRFTSLKPPMNSVANPFTLLAMLNAQQWCFVAVSFLAWSWDSFDYFTVSLTVSDLAETFETSTTNITWGITLVLMLRSIGSIIFGIMGDRYGRKWYAQLPVYSGLSLIYDFSLGPLSSTCSFSSF